jgi:nitroreductase
MKFNQPVSELIRKRYSCRTYQEIPIRNSDLSTLNEFIGPFLIGPLGSRIRFKIVAAKENDSKALKGLGTYGFIKNPTGFVLGKSLDTPGSLEDFGYLMETILLKAAEIDIGSCWLGGTFTKSGFVRLMDLQAGEIIPSVASLGYPADQTAWVDRVSRLYAGADRRLPWGDLFFSIQFGTPLTPEDTGAYKNPLELVRLAPSASNKQPWRIVKIDHAWHFYIFRNRQYPPPVFVFLLNLADLQRIDLGIAMSHFELSAREQGLSGTWQNQDPGISLPDPLIEYSITWVEED